VTTQWDDEVAVEAEGRAAGLWKGFESEGIRKGIWENGVGGIRDRAP